MDIRNGQLIEITESESIQDELDKMIENYRLSQNTEMNVW